MKTEKNNKRNFKEKSAGKQWAGKSEAKKYADKKKTEFKKNVTKKTEQKKYEQKKEEQKKTVGKSLCPVHGRCGGCQLLDMPYEEAVKTEADTGDKASEAILSVRRRSSGWKIRFITEIKYMLFSDTRKMVQ